VNVSLANLTNCTHKDNEGDGFDSGRVFNFPFGLNSFMGCIDRHFWKSHPVYLSSNNKLYSFLLPWLCLFLEFFFGWAASGGTLWPWVDASGFAASARDAQYRAARKFERFEEMKSIWGSCFPSDRTGQRTLFSHRPRVDAPSSDPRARPPPGPGPAPPGRFARPLLPFFSLTLGPFSFHPLCLPSRPPFPCGRAVFRRPDAGGYFLSRVLGPCRYVFSARFLLRPLQRAQARENPSRRRGGGVKEWSEHGGVGCRGFLGCSGVIRFRLGGHIGIVRGIRRAGATSRANLCMDPAAGPGSSLHRSAVPIRRGRLAQIKRYSQFGRSRLARQVLLIYAADVRHRHGLPILPLWLSCRGVMICGPPRFCPYRITLAREKLHGPPLANSGLQCILYSDHPLLCFLAFVNTPHRRATDSLRLRPVDFRPMI